MSAEQYDGLTDAELRQLLLETISKMSDDGCAELLDWAKKELVNEDPS